MIRHALTITLLLACSTHAAPYRATELGSLGGAATAVADLTDDGTVVGTSLTATGKTQAYIWSAGSMTSLEPAGSQRNTQAFAVNKDRSVLFGVVDPRSSVSLRGYLWKDGVVTLLPNLKGGLYSEARVISDSGVIGGWAWDNKAGLCQRPVVWRKMKTGKYRAVEVLNLSVERCGSVYALNATGEAVGDYLTTTRMGSGIFTIFGGTTTRIRQFASPVAVNLSREIVAYEPNYGPVIYKDGVVRNIDAQGQRENGLVFASDINNGSIVAGNTIDGAALWINGARTEIEIVSVDAGTPCQSFVLHDASAINNVGQITVNALCTLANGDVRGVGVLLTPVSP